MRAEGHAKTPLLVSVQGEQKPAVLRIPKLQATVEAGRCKPCAVGLNAMLATSLVMSSQGVHLVPVAAIPELNVSSLLPRQAASIRLNTTAWTKTSCPLSVRSSRPAATSHNFMLHHGLRRQTLTIRAERHLATASLCPCKVRRYCPPDVSHSLIVRSARRGQAPASGLNATPVTE